MPSSSSALLPTLDHFLTMWCNARRYAHPILQPVQSLRHVRFAAAPATGDRRDEFFLTDEPPSDAVALVQHTIGNAPHWLTIINHDPGTIKAQYGVLGYLPKADEYLMVLPDVAAHPPQIPASPPVHRVRSVAEAHWLNTHAATAVADPSRVTDPAIGYYYLALDQQPVAYGRLSLPQSGPAGVDSIYTTPAYRGRGLAAALLTSMHTDAARHGYQDAILMSTEAGHSVYRRYGYQDVACVTVLVSPVPA